MPSESSISSPSTLQRPNTLVSPQILFEEEELKPNQLFSPSDEAEQALDETPLLSPAAKETSKRKKWKKYFALLVATLLSLGLGALAFVAGLSLGGLPLALTFCGAAVLVNEALYYNTVSELLDTGVFKVDGKKITGSGKIGTSVSFLFSGVTAAALACATFVALITALSVLSGGALPVAGAIAIAALIAIPSAIGNTFLFLGPFRRFFAFISSKEARKEFISNIKRALDCRALMQEGRFLLDNAGKLILVRNLFTSKTDNLLRDTYGQTILVDSLGRELTLSDLENAKVSQDEKIHTAMRIFFKAIFFTVAITFAILASVAWVGVFNNGFNRFLGHVGASADKTAGAVATWLIYTIGFASRFPVFAEAISKQFERARSFFSNLITDFKKTCKDFANDLKHAWKRVVIDFNQAESLKGKTKVIAKTVFSVLIFPLLGVNTFANAYVISDGLPKVHAVSGHINDTVTGDLAQISAATGSGSVCLGGVENVVKKSWEKPSLFFKSDSKEPILEPASEAQFNTLKKASAKIL